MKSSTPVILHYMELFALLHTGTQSDCSSNHYRIAHVHLPPRHILSYHTSSSTSTLRHSI